MPDINPDYTGAITTAGDLFGMFNDTPQAQSLIQYLLTAEAQQIWVERGGFISVNKNVPIDAYPDDTSPPFGRDPARRPAPPSSTARTSCRTR